MRQWYPPSFWRHMDRISCSISFIRRMVVAKLHTELALKIGTLASQIKANLKRVTRGKRSKQRWIGIKAYSTIDNLASFNSIKSTPSSHFPLPCKIKSHSAEFYCVKLSVGSINKALETRLNERKLNGGEKRFDQSFRDSRMLSESFRRHRAKTKPERLHLEETRVLLSESSRNEIPESLTKEWHKLDSWL